MTLCPTPEFLTRRRVQKKCLERGLPWQQPQRYAARLLGQGNSMWRAARLAVQTFNGQSPKECA